MPCDFQALRGAAGGNAQHRGTRCESSGESDNFWCCFLVLFFVALFAGDSVDWNKTSTSQQRDSLEVQGPRFVPGTALANTCKQQVEAVQKVMCIEA